MDRRRDSGRIVQRRTQQERAEAKWDSAGAKWDSAGAKWDSAGAKWDSAGAKWDSAGLCAGVHVPPARRRGAGEEGEGADVRPKLNPKLPKLSETSPETFRNFARNHRAMRRTQAAAGNVCAFFASAQADAQALQTIEDWSSQAPRCVLRSYVCTFV